MTVPAGAHCRVIPGSHLGATRRLVDDDPESGSGVVVDGFFSPDDLVPLDVPAGAVMLFHAKLVHDSEPDRHGSPEHVMIYSHYHARTTPMPTPIAATARFGSTARSFER